MAKCKYKSKLREYYECDQEALADSKDGFCFFHERRKDKDIEKFNAGIKAKMENKDYNFTGYYFPAVIDFSKYNEGKFEDLALFTEAQFQGFASFAEAEFHWFASFDGAEFQDGTSFKRGEFQRGTRFDAAKFQDVASFDGAKFSQESRFGDAVFQARACFEEAKFQGEASFGRAEFQGRAQFDQAEFHHTASFYNTEFVDTAWFRSAKFHSWALFKAVKFQGEALFDSAEFQRSTSFIVAEFGRTASFRDADFKHPQDAEVAYRKAKISYQREGNYAEAGYYYLKEMRTRRKARLVSLKKSMEPRAFKKMARIAWAGLVQGLERVFVDWTCGYGEEPWKVILTALTLVFGCAFLYYFFFPITSPDIQITGVGWGYFKDCLYFSFVTFTTLGYGDLRPMAEVGTRAVASIEAFTGAFMIALFVLCFARKWMR